MNIPNNEINPTDIVPNADLVGVSLNNADLSNAALLESNLNGANLSQANLTEAVLDKTILTEARLDGANLTGATLVKADLVKVRLDGATLTDATLVDADLSNAVLADADLTGADLRGTDLSGVAISRGTKVGELTELEQNATTAKEWDEIARTYHELKNAFSENGLIGGARRYHILEQRARGREAKDSEGIRGTLSWIGSEASRFLLGYGVGLWRVVAVSLILFILSTTWYMMVGIQDAFSYSVITFATSPPRQLPSDVPTQIVAVIETFFGTLLIVLLGYVLGNREQF